ncbi:MAG: hypothetical protein HQK77_08275 [Desulfobacterales bacterium]|nr:hypothetical protein [Desulfobacterales bacterium]
MKRLGLLMVMLALLVGFVAPVSAAPMITAEEAGRGDALIFPMYYLNGNNTFKIRNNYGEFVQVHVRFRAAISSIELRDFDIVLSPFDVVSFELKPYVTQDGITIGQIVSEDQSFRYTAQSPWDGKKFSTNFDIRQTKQVHVRETAQEYEHNYMFGYVEVIGEAVLVGLANARPPYHQRADSVLASKKQINAWMWQATTDLGGMNEKLADVPNCLTGVQYCESGPSTGVGVALEALALQNFRTNQADVAHRDGNNYPLDGGVILHHPMYEDSRWDFNRDYMYYPGIAMGSDKAAYELPLYEQTMAWHTSFGPTWLDGDDDPTVLDEGDFFYSPAKNMLTSMGAIALNNPANNSLDEVEAALSACGGTTSHYFNNDKKMTAIVITYPTKHLHFPYDTKTGQLFTGWTDFVDTVGDFLKVGCESAFYGWGGFVAGSKYTCAMVPASIFDNEENQPTPPPPPSFGDISPIQLVPVVFPDQMYACHEVNFMTMDLFKIPFKEGWIGIAPTGLSWANAYIGVAITVNRSDFGVVYNTVLN